MPQPKVSAAIATPIPAPDPITTKHQLESTTFGELILKLEHRLFRFLSFFLLLHGTLSLFDELVQIFYVFPYLNQGGTGFHLDTSFTGPIYRRSLVIGATALIETFYGLAMIGHHRTLATRFHLVSGLILLLFSFLSYRFLMPVDLSSLPQIPPPPSLYNLLSQPSLNQALSLFSPPPLN